MRRKVLVALTLSIACSAPSGSVAVSQAPTELPAPAAAPAAPTTTTTTASAPEPPAAQKLVRGSCADKPLETDASRPLVPPAPAAGGTIMSARFNGGMGFFRVSGDVTQPRAAADGPVELRLAAPAPLGVSSPISLSLTFASTAKAPVTLLRPLDGSLERWRDPTYDLYLRDEANGEVYAFAFHGGRCGNVNPIGKDDYVTLAPGQQRQDVHTHGWADYLTNATIARPGTYSAWVVYRVCGRAGGAPLGADVVRSDLHHGVHASNAVRLVVQ